MKMDVDDSCGIKIKEEAKECLSPTSTTAHVPSVTGATTNVPTTTTTTTTSKLTTTNNNPEPSPVNLNLKPRNKGSSQPLKERLDEAAPLQSTPGPEARPTSPIVQIRASTQSSGVPRSTGIHDQVCRTGSRSSDSDSPLPQLAKIENGESIVGRLLTVNVTVHDDTSSGSASRTPHAKLKRLLGTLVQFANNISTETGDTVRNLVFSLLSGAMTAEEFHRALQDATNVPLRGFVLPYLKHTLPSLQRDLNNAARANKQTSAQYLRSNKSVLEAASFSPGEAAEVFGERNNVGPVSGSIFPQYSIGTTSSNSNNGTNSGSNNISAGPAPGVHGNQHHNSSNIHHYPGPPPPPHSLKRRASDTPYYETGAGGPLFEDGPLYGKRSMNPWPSHHPLHHQRQQQQHQQHQAPDAYCWYHPLHLSCGSQTSLQNHPQSSMPPSLVQINPLPSSASSISSAVHLAHQQPRVSSQQNESCPAGSIALDDEWKNIHVMLDCILGMVEKTKTALAILQRRGCPSPAIPVTAVATSGTSSLNNGPVPTTGAQPEPVASDRDNSLKRITGEIFAQTIKAAEDRVAEVQRRAEEEMLEAKRAAVAEVQRAISAAAAAESREVERLRVHHRFFEPQLQRNHGHSLVHGIGHGPLLRVVEVTTCSPTAGTTTSTTTTAGNLSGGRDEDKESLPLLGSSCWNCRRQALETCGGCGIARYCGSFCQHRDWEAGGHHASCNPRRSPPPPPPLPPPPPPRPTSRSPTASSAAVAAPGAGLSSSTTAAPSSATGHAGKER